MPNIQLQFRRGTALEWSTANPTLALGEMGIEIDTKLFKIGDGETSWNDLAYGGIQGPQGIAGSPGEKGDPGDPGSSGSVFTTGPVDLHNGGRNTVELLQFTDGTKQSVITGPTPAAGDPAQRIIIQGQRATGQGEGGDVYVWGGDSDVNGGDIKIYAGDADSNQSGDGGYVNIAAGRGYYNGGDLNLDAGRGFGPSGVGGDRPLI